LISVVLVSRIFDRLSGALYLFPSHDSPHRAAPSTMPPTAPNVPHRRRS